MGVATADGGTPAAVTLATTQELCALVSCGVACCTKLVFI